MRSRTLDYLDNGIAYFEGTKDRTEHWFRAHCSWAWRTHTEIEEMFTISISITGKLRERVRQLAVAKIRRTLEADLGGRINGAYEVNQLIEQNGRCEDWLAALPQTGKVRTQKLDHEAISARHRSARV